MSLRLLNKETLVVRPAIRMSSSFPPSSESIGNDWIVGEGGGGFKIWQPKVASPYRELNGHRPFEVWDLGLCGDGLTVFSVGDDHILRSWDLASGVEKTSAGPRSILVSCVAVSPDGRWVAAGGSDQQCFLRRAGGRFRKGHVDTVRALRWTTDGQLNSAGRDRKILTWDSEGGITRERLEPERIRTISFAHTGLRVPVPQTNPAVFQSRVRINPRSTTQTDSGNTDHQKILNAKADELLALGMNQGALRLWYLPTEKALFEAQHHDVQLNTLAFSSDGRTLAVGGSDAAVYLWHVATGRNVVTFDQLGSLVHRVIFSPDGTQLLAALHDGTIRIWSAPKISSH